MNRSIANTTAIALTSLLATTAFAADDYTVDSRHTFPVFEVNHMGFSTQRGRFNKTAGKISLDIAAKKGSVEIIIDTAALDMGADDWNKHMKSEDFFNVEKFPNMRFTSDQLVFDGDKPVAAEGKFTLLGITRPLTLTINNFRCAPHPMYKKYACGADITATLKRSDFGMAKYIPGVSDEIRIMAPVEASKD